MSLGKILRFGRQRRPINWAQSHLIFDGDSLMASHASSVSNRVPARIVAYPPCNGRPSHSMLAIGGQSLQAMIDSAADVDSAYVPGKSNVLVTFAGTNGMMPTGGAAQAERMRTYIAARRAAHPDLLIVLGNVLPRHESTSIPERFAETLIYNATIAANWRSWGVSAFVDLRPGGSAFDLPDASLSSFTRPQTLPLWSTADPAGVYTHLSDAGAAYVARRFTDGLRRL